MTNLTEKWKKGELPDGFYWCDVDIYEDGNITKQIESFIHHHPVFYWETSIVRVIELAPSFSEYKSMQEENTKLKEILKGAKEIIDWYKADCGYRDIPTEVTLQHINRVLGE